VPPHDQFPSDTEIVVEELSVRTLMALHRGLVMQTPFPTAFVTFERQPHAERTVFPIQLVMLGATRRIPLHLWEEI
jgi:hypothetical protein